MTGGDATRWVRAAYPDGIPDHDAPALLAVLEQHVGGPRAREVLSALRDDGLISPAGAALVLPDEARRRAVAARLVTGGWPLAREDAGAAAPGVAETRAPRHGANGTSGLSDRDLRDLMGLLGRRISSEARSRPLRETAGSALGDLASVIGDLVGSLPSEQELRRLGEQLSRLARQSTRGEHATGWGPESPASEDDTSTRPAPEAPRWPSAEAGHSETSRSDGPDTSDGHWPGTDRPGPDGSWS